MRRKDQIDELEARLDHLQDRMESAVNFIKSKDLKGADYYWRKFEDLLAWSKQFDANSDEHREILRVAWMMMNKFLEYVFGSTTKEEDNGE